MDSKMNAVTTIRSKKYLCHIFSAVCACMLMAGCGDGTFEADGRSEVVFPEPEIIYEDTDITLPAGLAGSEISEKDISNIDEDSETITYSIAGNELGGIIDGLAADINSSIAVILADKDHYPNITAITPNSDYTEFTIALEGGTFNTYESMLSMSFYIVGNKYQIYNGVSDEDALTVVRYVDSATGNIISETDSSLMNYGVNY